MPAVMQGFTVYKIKFFSMSLVGQAAKFCSLSLRCSAYQHALLRGLQCCPFLGCLLRVGLIKLSQMSVRPSVRPSTKSFLDFNEIWYVGRGR